VHCADQQQADHGRAAGEDRNAGAGACGALRGAAAGLRGRSFGSNLRIARSHATISDGASTISRLLHARRGLHVGEGIGDDGRHCACVVTTSSRPGITAEPPASRMWSTLWYCVEVKKNCSALHLGGEVLHEGRSTSASKSSGRPPERLAFSASSGLMP
jgi:hypothetical protein